MKRSALFVSLCAAATLMSGCAAIVSDSDYPVAFNSTPSGATVTVINENNIRVAREKTPFTTTLKASDGYFDRMRYSATFEKACYEGRTIPLQGGVDGWYWVNILFGGLIGLFIVDPVTGSMYTVDSLPPVVMDRVSDDPQCDLTQDQTTAYRSRYGPDKRQARLGRATWQASD